MPCLHSVPPPRSPHPATGFPPPAIHSDIPPSNPFHPFPHPAPIPPPRPGTSFRRPATGFPFRRPAHSASPRSLLYTPIFRPRPGTPFRPPVPGTPLPALRPRHSAPPFPAQNKTPGHQRPGVSWFGVLPDFPPNGYFTPKSLSRSEKLSYSVLSEAIRSRTDWIFSARHAFAPQNAYPFCSRPLKAL